MPFLLWFPYIILAGMIEFTSQSMRVTMPVARDEKARPERDIH